MKHKTLRHIVTIFWGMIFCVNLYVCLWIPNPRPISWIMVGLPLGCILIMLQDNLIIKSQDRIITMVCGTNINYFESNMKLIKRNKELEEKQKDKRRKK